MKKQTTMGFLLLLFLCSACESYKFSNLQLRRQGWDILEVETSFTRKSLLSGTAVLPVHEEITVSTPSKGVFYRGSDHEIVLPDRDLPSGAEIRVEVKAEFENGTVLTEEQIIKASPKSYSMRNRIDYPVEDATNQLRYRVFIEKDRPLMEGSSETEVIETGLLFPTTLRLSLQSDPSVSITTSLIDSVGTIDLSQSNQFAAFESGLGRSASQESSTVLQVEAVSNILGEELKYNLADIIFEKKTKEEQITFCRPIAGNIATFLQRSISPNTGRNANARINEESCSYNPITRKYSFSIDCYWESRMFNNPWSDYRLFQTWGTVTVNESGKWEFVKVGANQALIDSDEYEQVLSGVVIGAAVLNSLSNENQ